MYCNQNDPFKFLRKNCDMVKIKIWFEPTVMNEPFNGALCYNFKKNVFCIRRDNEPNSMCVVFKAELLDGEHVQICPKDYLLLQKLAICGELKQSLTDNMFLKDGSLYIKDTKFMPHRFDYISLGDWVSKYC